jgi:hypothetical protein
MTAAPMVSVYDGQTARGFILNRGRLGFEAFDVDQKSLGLFPTQQAAATKIMELKMTTESARAPKAAAS